MSMSRFNNSIVILILVLAVVVVLFAYAYIQKPHTHANIGSNWSEFTLNYNNSRYQQSSEINASSVQHLRLAWVINTGNVTSTPVVYDGNVFFGDFNGDLYSANIMNGSINWKTNVGAAISSTPDIYNGMVFIGYGPLGATDVSAFYIRNGSSVWNTRLNTTMNAIWASPTIYNGLLYTGVASAGLDAIETNTSQKGALYALDVKSGKVDWVFNTSISNTGGAGVWGTVVVDPQTGSIYFGTGNPFGPGTNSLYSYSIMSLNAETGRLNWFYNVYNSLSEGHDRDFGSTPNLFSYMDNGITYNAIGVGMKNGYYYVLDRKTGSFLGEYHVDNNQTVGSLGIVGLSGFVYMPNQMEPELFIPSYNNGPNNGVVEALFPSNWTVSWRFNTPKPIVGSVALVPGAVLFGDVGGNIYAVSQSSGDRLFHSMIPASIDGGISVSGNYVLVPGSFGPADATGIYAFTPAFNASGI